MNFNIPLSPVTGYFISYNWRASIGRRLLANQSLIDTFLAFGTSSYGHL